MRMAGNVKKETDSLQIRKPKYQEHDSIQGIAKRIKKKSVQFVFL